MKINEAHQRLQSLWGIIDRQHNAQIAHHLKAGSRVLDVGCGYGALVAYLSQQGHDVQGVDLDAQSIEVAKAIFPDARVELGSAEDLADDFAGQFDAILLKDVLHHIVGEGDPIASFNTFARLLKDDGRIVILDPNPMWILRLARLLVRHEDPEASPQTAVKLLSEMGYTVQALTYFEVIGLPLSGGYVGYRLVPNWKPLNALVAAANALLSRMFAGLGLGRFICWRYIIRADKTS